MREMETEKENVRGYEGEEIIVRELKRNSSFDKLLR